MMGAFSAVVRGVVSGFNDGRWPAAAGAPVPRLNKLFDNEEVGRK